MGKPPFEKRYFEEFDVGDEFAVEDVRTITDSDINTFAGLTADVHPIHMSDPYVADHPVLEARVAHGTLVFAIVSSWAAGIVLTRLSYGYESVRFVEPVYVGDTLSIYSEVVETSDHSEQFGKVIERYEATNQHDETVLVAEHISLVERRA
ncbi:MaoC family dehydratase [Haloplanus litoreus]|uniref:MaoC family dehydratase n=1 Tax=Haloplanus litoreus TaxID=767515 RepID=A0ABD6A1T8_9EURY